MRPKINFFEQNGKLYHKITLNEINIPNYFLGEFKDRIFINSKTKRPKDPLEIGTRVKILGECEGSYIFTDERFIEVFIFNETKIGTITGGTVIHLGKYNSGEIVGSIDGYKDVPPSLESKGTIFVYTVRLFFMGRELKVIPELLTIDSKFINFNNIKRA